MPAADLPSAPRPSAGRVLRDVVHDQRDVLAVIALGGVLGSLARWGVSLALPHPPSAVAWSTALVNVAGCLAIGALMVVVLEIAPPSRYLRPFVGTGVLGGLTTFSTFTLDAARLLDAGRPAAAAAYVVGSLVGGLAAVWLGATLARLVHRTALAVSLRHGDGDEDPGSTS